MVMLICKHFIIKLTSTFSFSTYKTLFYLVIDVKICVKRWVCNKVCCAEVLVWETATSTRFYDVRPNPREWAKLCYYLSKWRFD